MQQLEPVRTVLRQYVAVSADQKHRHVGVEASDLLSKLDAVHPGHDDVRKDHVEALCVLRQLR